MKVDVFDDLFSIGHLVLGCLTAYIHKLFIIFFVYEFVEFCYKRRKREESVESFIGDILEYFFGLGVVLLWSMI